MMVLIAPQVAIFSLLSNLFATVSITAVWYQSDFQYQADGRAIADEPLFFSLSVWLSA